jgi:hypothetical protein
MKRRRVPNTISKRLRRKLRRAKNPYLLWLRLRRPRLYARLQRWWLWKLLDTITNIPPTDTPFFSAGRIEYSDWKVDP